MARQVITDAIWSELEVTLRKYGCHRWKNDRNIMEAILWKLRTGAPWRDVPKEFCLWKTAYNRFNRWSAKGLWEKFFLAYEMKLIRNRYSPMEATYALISMQVELGGPVWDISIEFRQTITIKILHLLDIYATISPLKRHRVLPNVSPITKKQFSKLAEFK